MIQKISMCALALLAGAHILFAQTTVSIAASKDNTIYEDVTGELSNRAGSGSITGVNESGEIKRALSVISTIKSDIFTLYPNPFTSEIRISGSEYDDIMTLKILNAQMQKVYLNSSISANDAINLEYLLSGIYYAIIETRNGITTKK